MKKTIFIAMFLLQTCFTAMMYSSVDESELILEVKDNLLSEPTLDKQGNAYLHRVQNAETARHLIKKGFNVHARNVFNQTPLHLAQNPAIVAALVEAGASVDAVDSYGNSPIFYASNIAKINTLMANGASVNIKNNDQKNALYYQSDPEIAAKLILHGADFSDLIFPDILDSENIQTALRYIKDFKDLETARKMYYHGDKINPTVKKAYDDYVFRKDPISLDLLLESPNIKDLFKPEFLAKRQEAINVYRHDQKELTKALAKRQLPYDAFNSKSQRGYGL
jgi:hypothetical protein